MTKVLAKPARIAVLASGRGSNLQALLDACHDGRLRAHVVMVASDRADAHALRRAEAAGIATLALDPSACPSRAAFDADLFDRVAASGAEFVVLAGFMRIIDAHAVAAWHGRMLNIHPSLLPKYRGLRTHRRALKAGDTVHGASVHFVSGELDGGPVVAQARVPIHAGDNEASLTARVLGREHALLVASVAAVVDGDIVLDPQRGLRYRGAVLSAPLQLGDDEMLHASG